MILRIESENNKEVKGVELPFKESLYEHSDVVSKVTRNPWSGEVFCSSSWDGSIQFWSFKESVIDFVKSISVGKPVYDSLWFTKDLIISSSATLDKGMVSQIDVRTRDVKVIIESDNATRAICRVNENLIATIWDSHKIILTDMRSTKESIQTIESDTKLHALDLIKEDVLLIGCDHVVRLWDVKSNKEIWRNAVLEADAINAVTALSNSVFAYSTMDGTLSINRI